LPDPHFVCLLAVLLQSSLDIHKQGHSLFVNDWKTRWCTLTDDILCFR
jgi:hypothetical protein